MISTILNAVVTKINATPALGLTASREYRPSDDLAALATTDCAVRLKSWAAQQPIAKGMRDQAVAVVLRKLITTNSSVDTVLELAEDVAELFADQALTSTVQCVAAEVAIDDDALHELSLAHVTVTLTYRY